MPTSVPAALFLFAHQDDEFGVFHRIEQERLQGHRVLCAYLTDGATPKVQAGVRNAESLRVLRKLGVADKDVVFAGESLGIADARLLDHLEPAAQWLRDWFAQHDVAAIYVPAWEGGHPDHDALHALAAHIAEAMGLAGKVWQFALYNAWQRRSPWFRVLSPLPANGAAHCDRMAWGKRLQYLRLCLGYPSQAASWLGLLPFVLVHYVARGTQCVQPVDAARTRERPHEGKLYYEARGFSSWEHVSARLRGGDR